MKFCRLSLNLTVYIQNEIVIIEFLGKSEKPEEVKTAIFFAFEKESLLMMGNPEKYLRKANEVIEKIKQLAK